jgi:hypothetical protein
VLGDLEASAGGNVADILSLVSNDIKESHLSQAEKELKKRPIMNPISPPIVSNARRIKSRSGEFHSP